MSTKIEQLTSSRAELVDLAAVVVLTALALFGFRAAFDGSDYLVVGLSAAVLGTATAWVATKLGSNVVTTVALLLLVFVLAGQGLATRGRALGGVVPTPDALAGLVDGLLHGWSRLLTSLPRSGTEDNVLAVPYLTAFVTAMTSTLLALKAPRRPWCVLPPLALLFLTILLGAHRPASLVLQGAVLAATTLAWMSFRHLRQTPNVTEGLPRRVVRGSVLLAAASALGLLAGPFLPFATAHGRFVLRDHITPPLDLASRPSPLGAYRAWLSPQRADAVQMVLDGWPKGARVRVAAMDSYDGVVWNLAGSAPGSSAVYERIGTTLPVADNGISANVTVRPGPLLAPYVPTAGEVRSIRATGPGADELVAGLRVSRGTETALQTVQSTGAEAYQLKVVLPDAVPEAKKATLAFDPRVQQPNSPVTLPPDLKSALDSDVAGAVSPYAKAEALAKRFHDEGYFSDGGIGTKVAPGHSLVRLLPILLHPERAQGDSEQYAAAMALAARAEGMPARVVMGFQPTGSGNGVQVMGRDVAAWVEVAFDSVGWVAFDPTPDRSRTNLPAKAAEPKQQKVRAQVPPLRTPKVVARTAADAKSDQKSSLSRAKVAHTHSLVVRLLVGTAKVGGLLLVPLSPVLLVLFLKGRRRQRRRTAGSAAQRISAGWSELLDLTVDLKLPVPARGTRLEVAQALGEPEIVSLAAQADQATFAPHEPAENAATEFWQNVDASRRALLSPLTRKQRWQTLLSVRSLRPTT